jgi:hypothetical protein
METKEKLELQRMHVLHNQEISFQLFTNSLSKRDITVEIPDLSTTEASK